jgi:CRP-like cAMP-binding protein
MTNTTELSNLFIFKNVPARSLQELCIMAPPVRFASGATIFKQGADSDVALLLVKGRLGVEVSAHGERREVGQVNVGEIVGETALFGRESNRNATVLAIEQSQCLLINQELLVSAATNPAILAIEKHLLGTLTRRIRRTNQETSKIWKEAGLDKIDEAADEQGFVTRLRNLFGGGK